MLRRFTDMTGSIISLEGIPQRIVSVVPSQTELLFDLGLDTEVAAITRFCIHPQQWFRSKQRVGGTKQLHLDKIAAIVPDLILANKEENTKAEIEGLAERFPVWISDIHNLEGALHMIREISLMTGKESAGYALNAAITAGFNELEYEKKAVLKAAYFIWRKPWMSVGRDTFIHDMLQRCGWQNVYERQNRYPETTLEELASLQPDLVLLSSEPYPFKEQHIQEIRTVLPQAAIRLADGEMFSWYGSRLKSAPAYFRQLCKD